MQLVFGKLLFQTHNPDSVILRKYLLLSNQSFKNTLAHILSLNLTPKFSFEFRFRMFIINSYYTRSKRLQSLDSLLLLLSVLYSSQYMSSAVLLESVQLLDLLFMVLIYLLCFSCHTNYKAIILASQQTSYILSPSNILQYKRNDWSCFL